MVGVRLVDVKKRFGKYEALRGITLEIRDGELFFLLGPSGCGKTTTLRIIAGLYEPDSGEVYFGDRLMNGVPPYRRNIGMVFQNYALWPHMTVYDNVAYGLKARGLPRSEIEEKVRWALDLVGLRGMEGKYPNQLSGGQQQRVALARALVIEPEVLLLDEPLSNLDAKLRARMRSELKVLQKELGITTIYVTHDQAEALSMADRIAVMNIGRVEQVGAPREVYRSPATRFVADFIGEINFLDAEVGCGAEGCWAETPLGRIPLPRGAPEGRVTLAFRPEAVRVVKGSGMRVRTVLYYGFYEDVHLEGGGVELRARLPAGERWFGEGDEVGVEVDPEDVTVFRV